jgi:hypothetical protein
VGGHGSSWQLPVLCPSPLPSKSTFVSSNKALKLPVEEAAQAIRRCVQRFLHSGTHGTLSVDDSSPAIHQASGTREIR